MIRSLSTPAGKARTARARNATLTKNVRPTMARRPEGDVVPSLRGISNRGKSAEKLLEEFQNMSNIGGIGDVLRKPEKIQTEVMLPKFTKIHFKHFR
jgi:hypothetical protein